MKALYDIVVKSLAILGLVYLGFTLSSALKKHYQTICVEDNADDYGFTVPQIRAGLAPTRGVYGGYYE